MGRFDSFCLIAVCLVPAGPAARGASNDCPAQPAAYNPYSAQSGGYNPYGSSIVLYSGPMAPFEPTTIEDCAALESSYQAELDSIVAAHESCLCQSSEPNHAVANPATDCSKNACQPLHTQMYNAEQDGKRIQSAYAACVSSVQDLQRRQQEQQQSQQDQTAAQQPGSSQTAGSRNPSSTKGGNADSAKPHEDPMAVALAIQQARQAAYEQRTAARQKQIAALEKKQAGLESDVNETASAMASGISQAAMQVATVESPGTPDASAEGAPDYDFSGLNGQTPPYQPAVAAAGNSPLPANSSNDPSVAPAGPNAPAAELSPIYEPKTSEKSPFTFGYTISHFQCAGELKARPRYVDLLSDTYAVCREDFADPSDPAIFSSAMDSQGFAQLQAVKQVCGEDSVYLRTGWYFEYEGRPEEARREAAEQSRQQFIHDRIAAGVKIVNFPVSSGYARNCN